MSQKLLTPSYLEKQFNSQGYTCINPHNIVNPQKDTVFVTAGIQSILQDVTTGTLQPAEKIHINQPVIRTQSINSLDEFWALAFINSTTAAINNSHETHLKLVNDWFDIFFELGFKKESFSTKEEEYEGIWGDITVKGIKTFHYYKDPKAGFELELGDTTFYHQATSETKNLKFDTFSDLGFGLERLRWWTNPNSSYYDLYSKTKQIDPRSKALISSLALLAVNQVEPSNKDAGYRARQFSKLLVSHIGINGLPKELDNYLNECINYWITWQKQPHPDINTCREKILNELTRNENREIINRLQEEGYPNITGIDINTSRIDFYTRLNHAGINKKTLRKVINNDQK